MIEIEHVNTTVRDVQATVAWIKDVFGWTVRWEGSAMNGLGHTVHIGTDRSYVALYQPKTAKAGPENDYLTAASLNHIGVTVDDLDAVEARVKAAGFTPHSHADYEPGRRFYFHDADTIEWEIVSYG